MSLSFTFDKAAAERRLACILQNAPIAPCSPEGWSQDELLQAASSLLFMAFAIGPSGERHSPENLKKAGREQSEAVFLRFQDELFATAKLLTNWTQLVLDEEYDAKFEPLVAGKMKVDAAGDKLITFKSGSRVPDTRKGDSEMRDGD